MGTVQFDFSGETVVVTGGASGIGRAVACAFGGAGATVLVADRHADPNDRRADTPTHEVIEREGGTAEFVETDVADPAQVEALVDRAREYGGVDVMVNNAGVNRHGTVLDLEYEDFETMQSVNEGGVLAGMQAAANDMLDRGEPGCIINTASISSNEGQHGQVGYDATKGAIRMLTRTAALELGADGIRVNAVAPGQIATEFSAGWTERAERGAREDELLKPVPLGRAGHPEDLASAYLWLASEGAGYVTGELLQVDGGWQTC